MHLHFVISFSLWLVVCVYLSIFLGLFVYLCKFVFEISIVRVYKFVCVCLRACVCVSSQGKYFDNMFGANYWLTEQPSPPRRAARPFKSPKESETLSPRLSRAFLKVWNKMFFLIFAYAVPSLCKLLSRASLYFCSNMNHHIRLMVDRSVVVSVG